MPNMGCEEFEIKVVVGSNNGQSMDGTIGTMGESGIIVRNVGCYNCDERTGGGLCVNFPLSFSVVIKFWFGLVWLFVGWVFFFLMYAVDMSEDCVMNVDFNDNFKRVIHRGKGGRSSA